MSTGAGRDETLAAAGPRRSAGAASRLAWAWLRLRLRFADAFRREAAERRFFLWLPAAAGAGVLLYMAAEREPVLWVPGALAAIFAALAVALRGRPIAFRAAVALAAVFCGFFSAGWRSARVAAPVLDRFRFVHLTGYVEQMDFRRVGARFVLRVESADELAAGAVPYRVRVTTKRTPEVEAGAFVTITARLLPPAQAALPDGYSFARDAYFARIGGVGNVPGRIVVTAAPHPPDWMLAAGMALDRARNALARRVYEIIRGDAGAIAAAMVTGKRDLLSEDAKTLIRQAGIFHIITISGVQMTLVAGILFFTIRRLLACSRTLALRHPIKKWAAAAAMVGAVAYDIATGSRVGTERALYMTLIVLGSVLVDRRALTMRNLAYAALAVIAFEPEAILGASFQLSFAAVAALVAVFEAHTDARRRAFDDVNGLALRPPPRAKPGGVLGWVWMRLSGTRRLLLATLCATSATASFMAFNFHDLSPYVLIGNPLTLALIEFFAVPGALVGAALYPLGLDGFVWHYLGFGISFIMWVAGHIAAAPGSTVHLNAFAPWAILFLALAVLSVVIWRSVPLRLTALPLLAIGIAGASAGPRYDVVVLPTGDAAAVRGGDGRLAIVAPRTNTFAAEQWLSADGDSADERAGHTMPGSRCDRSGCVAPLPDGRTLSLVLKADAFEEDCERSAVIVTRLTAPPYCAGKVVVDAPRLRAGGATALTFGADGTQVFTARTAQTDRPWMPAVREKPAWQPRVKEETGEEADPGVRADTDR